MHHKAEPHAAPTDRTLLLPFSLHTCVCVCVRGVNKDVGVRLLSYMTVETLGGCGNTDTDSRLELELLPSPPPAVPLTCAPFPCSALPSAAAAAFVELSALTLHTHPSSSNTLSASSPCVARFLGVHPSGL